MRLSNVHSFTKMYSRAVPGSRRNSCLSHVQNSLWSSPRDLDRHSAPPGWISRAFRWLPSWHPIYSWKPWDLDRQEKQWSVSFWTLSKSTLSEEDRQERGERGRKDKRNWPVVSARQKWFVRRAKQRNRKRIMVLKSKVWLTKRRWRVKRGWDWWKQTCDGRVSFFSSWMLYSGKVLLVGT